MCTRKKDVEKLSCGFEDDKLRISMTNKPYDIVYSLKLERGKIQKIDVEL